jgi:peptidoglycan/xylan/chitin deacetylase (PgdA/CDA1 family)
VHPQHSDPITSLPVMSGVNLLPNTTRPRRLPDALLRMFCRRGGGIIANYHTLTADQTRAHVTFLARYFDFVTHDDFLTSLHTRRRRPFCFLTFDDGKKSNATETAPVLRQLGVPAAFYVPTEFLSQSDRPLWFDRATALRAHVSDLDAELDLNALKQLPCNVRDHRLDEACGRYGVDADMTDDNVRPMSWDDARTLHRQGFIIGSHSEWHAILTKETADYARVDITRSLDRVSIELNTRCRSFSFPNGNYTDSLALHARECGALSVLTTEPTWAGPNSQTWRLPRVQLFGAHGPNYAAIKIAAARIPRLLKNPDGSGRWQARIRSDAA